MSQSLYLQLTKNLYYYLQVKKAKQKKRSATFKKERRKRYRMRKKESWKDMALNAFKRRCQERIARSNAIYAKEIEEKNKEDEETKLQAAKQLEQRELLKKTVFAGS